MIEFFIEGTPIGKERPRLGKWGVYTPQKTQTYEKLIGGLALVARNAANVFSPLENLLCVEMEINCKSKKSADIDNIIKSVLDGMNKIIYHDDSQVVALDCAKYFDCETEGIKVAISPLDSERHNGSKKLTCPGCHSFNIRIRSTYEKGGYRYVCLNDQCSKKSFIAK